MTKTDVLEKKKAKDAQAKKQLTKDQKRATELSEVIDSLEKELDGIQSDFESKIKSDKEEYEKKIAPVKTLFEGKASTVIESMKAAKEELVEIGNRQKKTMFDINKNWHFENGLYLHVKSETVIKTNDSFDLSKFIKKFSQFIDWKFKVAPLTKLLLNGDERKRSKIDQFDLSLDTNDQIEIKRKAESKKKVD